MSVQNDVHNRASPIAVGDKSGTKRPAAPAKPGPEHPTPGNANATARPLPDVKRDPERARSTDIERGLSYIRAGEVLRPNEGTRVGEGFILEGESMILSGIDGVLFGLAGEKNRKKYDNAKPCTDEILSAYSFLPKSDAARLVNGVNEWLQCILIDGLGSARNPSEMSKAVNNAVKYVTDSGPNTMTPSDRLKGLIGIMKQHHVDPKIIDEVQSQCERAIAYAP